MRIMSKVMETSQWISFFRKAGLPPQVAANYALIFADNRIQVDMLLDLSKEYLYDMGIKVMGDVIAILKFAKEFHNQLAKERIIGNTTVASSNQAVAERMVGHYTRPLTTPIRPPISLKEPAYQRPKIISLKQKAVISSPFRKSRRVPPEEEGAYNIKMPLGTTERTRKILQLQKQVAQGAKRSVFARLGDSAVSSSTDSKVSSSVFERLGPSGKIIRDDTPSSTVTSDLERPKVKGPPLPYQGVLKMTVGKNRIVTTTSPNKVTTFKRTVIKPAFGGQRTTKVVKLNQINAIIQTSRSPNARLLKTVKTDRSQGLFGQAIRQATATQKLNVKSRLGGNANTRNLTRTRLMLTNKKSVKTSNVFDRLGR